MGSQILVTVLLLLGTVGLFVTMDLQKIADFGESLGYTGKDLQLFVKEQIDIQLAKEQAEREREERANAREAKKFEQELEKAKLEREKERERMEVEKARIEAEKEKVRLQVELEKEKAQIEMKERVELEKIKKENSMSEVPENGTLSLSGKPKMPKMPPFEDQKDNIDAYFHRFERIARTQAWPESQWAAYLSTLLNGKALEVYSRLDQNDAEKYEEVKAALLKRYDMTEDGFHQRFRTGKIETGETFSQFVVRIENYFTRWIELSSTEKTFEGVKDLLLREQILNSTGRDLSIFLRERKPKTAMEMAKLAEQFVEARGTGCSKFQNPLYSKSNKYVHPDRSKEKGYEDSRKVKNTDDKRESNKFVPINQRKCYACGEVGHMASRCSKPHAKGMKVASICQEDSVGMVQDGYINDDHGGARVEENMISDNNVGKVTSGTMCGMCGTMPICQGKVFDHTVQVLRDTGCSGVIVRKALVDKQHFTSDTQTCVMADSRAVVIPVAWITIDTPFYRGTVKAACLETPLCDLILGNIPGVRAPDNPFPELTEPVLAVETRGQKRVREEGKIPMKTMESVGISLSRNEFMEMQKQDESLKKMWKLAEENKVRNTTQGTSGYFIDHGLLYRRHVSAKVNNGKPVVQAVVPTSLRKDVLRVSHEALMGGHMGSKKTLDRVTSQFYWPGVQGDVRRYCISCDICQRTTPKGKVSKIPLGTMPLIETPFERVAVDLIGPIYPVTDRGNRYILTVVDYATRYPEAVALPRIETEYVAEALLEIFCRVGVPKEILTDMGSQFTSAVMKEVSRLLSLKQLTTTPYHPMCNGLVERFNGTLKTMLKRLSAERPQDWDRYIPALLFAYREVPQESLGFAPFDLLYGRKIRGPVQILRELWTKDIANNEVRTTYEYVVDLQNRIEDTMRLAHQELKKASGRYQKYYNARSKDRKMVPGDKVLVLLPTNQNKLLLQWKGPYIIEERFGIGNYRVRVGDKLKTYHANLLKKYVDREIAVNTMMCDVSIASLQYVGAGLVDVQEPMDEVSSGSEQLDVMTIPLTAKETYLDVDISPDLTPEQKQDVRELVAEYQDVLTDLPGRTDSIEYKIKLTSTEPIRSKPYPLPHHMREVVAREVESMLSMDVIEPSESPYAAPVVLIKKSDESYRFCTDFRRLNQISVFDPEPIPLAEAVFSKLSKCKYLTKIDISKAYWQIPMEEGSKKYTAFITPDGLYQWKVMPFGVVNAPAVFSRLMRKVLKDIPNVDNYIDDIIEGTEDWENHKHSLRMVFDHLRQHHLTARPSKVKIGYTHLEFLGHTVGEGQLAPKPHNLDKILNLARPETKKQVRALIGLTGYYRKFIPNFAAIAAPLTDLTKKGKSNKVEWTESQENAFQSLKKYLSTFPILRLPDLHKPFLVRTDASDVGIGGILLQEHENEKFPIMFVSRKLLKREKAYSTIEKECLAIVWAVQKLTRYLYGREFVLETDHQPLVWMSKAKLTNGRVMRWALALQPYRFLIRAVKGSENVGADMLSRCPP
ncbi:uncharacterized protein [Haliotis asinina]|uniref:uncharacterized protein n=1 Tax=Haliotis asinina TaxID=109174 RepID=UPI003531F06B